VIPFAEGALDPRRWRVLENITFVAVMDSSNDLARELIDMYFEEEERFFPTVLVAEAQPNARGRKGRWLAPAGRGLYFTIVRQARTGEPISLMPIAVARWLREALRESTGVRVRLKWPNDLYVGRRKLGGILAEARTQGEDTYVAIGVGLNVLGSPETLGVAGATTLEEEAGRAFALAPLLQAVLDGIDGEFAAPRWEVEVAAWEKASAHRRGDSMRVRHEGQEIVGRYAGLTAEGFLKLRTATGEAVLSHGEVSEW
jgi:BirA family biotin operon repressor/biotin-[acetyl-CoA-carboxylase] ligase